MFLLNYQFCCCRDQSNELTGDQDEEESETVVGDQVEALGQQRLHLRHQDFDRNVELKIE